MLGRCRYLGLVHYGIQACLTVLVLNLKRTIEDLKDGIRASQKPEMALQPLRAATELKNLPDHSPESGELLFLHTTKPAQSIHRQRWFELLPFPPRTATNEPAW